MQHFGSGHSVTTLFFYAPPPEFESTHTSALFLENNNETNL